MSEGEEKKRRLLLSNPKLQAILQTLTSLIAEFGCMEENYALDTSAGFVLGW